MSKYFYRIFTIIDLHFGVMQPCSSGLGMTLEASDFRSVRRLVAYSTHVIRMSLLEHAQNRERGVRVKRYMPRVLHFSAFISCVSMLSSTGSQKRSVFRISYTMYNYTYKLVHEGVE